MLNTELKGADMVDKDKIMHLLTQTKRKVDYMKADVFEKHVMDRQFKFSTFWLKEKINITIDIEEIDES